MERNGTQSSEQPQLVYLEIDTFSALDTEGDRLRAWVELVHDVLIEPILTSLRAAGPETMSIDIDHEPLRGPTARVYDFSEENWRLLIDQLGEGRLRRLVLLAQRCDEAGIPAYPGFHLAVDLGGLEFPDAAHSLSVSVARDLYPPKLPDEVQADWVSLAKKGAVDLCAATGYLTVDHASMYSPYEQSAGLTWLDGLETCATKLRGYYWGNILSSNHIAALGGLQNLVAASGGSVEDLSDGREELAYLQLTDDIDVIPYERLRDLKDVLKPVLLPGMPGFRYIGPPLRVIAD